MKRKGGHENQDAVNRGAWSAEEDQILVNYVHLHGEGKWGQISRRTGIYMCVCVNYLVESTNENHQLVSNSVSHYLIVSLVFIFFQVFIA